MIGTNLYQTRSHDAVEVRMRLAIHSLELGQVLLHLLRLSPVSNIAPMLHLPTYQRRNTTLPIDGLIKHTWQENGTSQNTAISSYIFHSVDSGYSSMAVSSGDDNRPSGCVTAACLIGNGWWWRFLLDRSALPLRISAVCIVNITLFYELFRCSDQLSVMFYPKENESVSHANDGDAITPLSAVSTSQRTRWDWLIKLIL